MALVWDEAQAEHRRAGDGGISEGDTLGLTPNNTLVTVKYRPTLACDTGEADDDTGLGNDSDGFDRWLGCVKMELDIQQNLYNRVILDVCYR